MSFELSNLASALVDLRPQTAVLVTTCSASAWFYGKLWTRRLSRVIVSASDEAEVPRFPSNNKRDGAKVRHVSFVNEGVNPEVSVKRVELKQYDVRQPGRMSHDTD